MVPTKKGQHKISFREGGLHASTGTPSSKAITPAKHALAKSGKLGPKAKKQELFYENVLQHRKSRGMVEVWVLIVLALAIVGGGAYVLSRSQTQTPLPAGTATPTGTTTTTTVTTTTQKSTGMLKGNMTIGPICPVERVDQPCNPTPAMYAAHLVYVYDSSRTKLITTLTPDGQGNFSTTLPEGSYFVDVEHLRIGSVTGAPRTVTIASGKTATLSISIDTGIR
jgi:hypothetical protein